MVWTILLHRMHLSSRKGSRGGQVLPKRRSTERVKLSLAAPGNLCGQPAQSWRYQSPQWGKFYGNDCSCTRTNYNWYKNSSLMIHPSGWCFVRTCWAGWKRIRVLSEWVNFSDEVTFFFYLERSTGTIPGYGDPRIIMLWSRWNVTVPKWTCFVPFPEDACSAHSSSQRTVLLERYTWTCWKTG